jgi:hypothetical protein
MLPLAPVPAFLKGTVAATRSRRRAGEWELDHGSLSAADLTTCLEGLLRAFPLLRVCATQSHASGIESTFDIELAWVDRHGQLGRSVFPECAQ